MVVWQREVKKCEREKNPEMNRNTESGRRKYTGRYDIVHSVQCKDDIWMV